MKQGLSSWAIRHPIPTVVLFCVLTLAGVMAFLRLPVNANPPVAFPLVSVAVVQPGAAPSEIESEITRRVENALTGLSGVRHIESTAKASESDTTVEFQLGTDPDRAVSDVRAAIGEIRGELPQNIPEPVIQRVDVEGGAMLQYVLDAPGQSSAALSWYVDDTVRRELLAVPGVQRVTRFGGATQELRIEPDPAVLAQYGMSIETLNAQLRDTYVNVPGGHLETSVQRHTIRVQGRQARPDTLGTLPIAMPGGRWLPLGELAHIRETVTEPSGFAQFNGEPAVGFSIWRGKGYSDTQVAERVAERLQALQAQQPGIAMHEVTSTVAYTSASYSTAMHTLVEGAVLTILVVFLFLRDWRATAIAAIALPLSILPVFLAMLWLNFTLNSITMLALTLVIGILVDDAIVEIENIDRHIHMGERPYRAALHAADGISLAVLATTLTIVAVFAPVGFVPGVIGQYFRQFGLTSAIAVLCSLLVARFLTPLLAAYFMRAVPASTVSAHEDESPKSGLMRRYVSMLDLALRHPWKTLAAATALFVVSIWVGGTLPSGFLPANDASLSQLRVTLSPGSSGAQAQQLTQRITDILRAHPAVKHVLAIAESPDEASFSITLLPRDERQLSRKAFEYDIRSRLAAVPDTRFQFLVEGNSEVSIMLVGRDAAALEAAARRVANDMRRLPQLANVQISLAPVRPELQVRPRPDDAARLGVSTTAIGDVLRTATAGEQDAQSAHYNMQERQIPLRVRLSERDRSDLDVLGSLRISSLTHEKGVPLSAVADIQYGEGQARIDRHDRQRRISIEANLQSASLGEALDAAQALPTLQHLPEGVQQVTYGDAEYMDEMFENFSLTMVASILTMYAILVLLFRSFLQPLTILFTLPLSLVGAIAALWLIGAALDLPAIIGLLMLMGIVTKNAILLVDFTIEGLRDGRSLHDALKHAGMMRARPIVMTTVAMVAGMVPAALGFGADSGFRIPMATAVIGGLVTSTLLSLVCVPVVFARMEAIRVWLGPRLARLTTVEPDDLVEEGSK